MTTPMTQAVAALARESRPYFREIEEGLVQWQADPGNSTSLTLARKRLRSIRGAAGMVGLDGLADAARQLNEALELAEHGPDVETVVSIRASVRPLVQSARLMEGHLDDLAQGLAGDTRLGAAQGQIQLWRENIENVQNAAHLSGQFVDVFREEAWTHLGVITKGLRDLQATAGHVDRLDSACRALHTLKGAAGVMGLYEASALAHELEDLVGDARRAREGGTGESRELQDCLQSVFHQLARCCGVPAEASGLRAVQGGPMPAETEWPVELEPQVRVPRESLELLGRLSEELTALPVDGSGHDRVRAEIAASVEHMRCASFATLEGRLQRTVLMTARRLGKVAVLHIEGGAADIDRGLLEELMAPLEHLLRNAVDHGLEDASMRVAAGKAVAGHIRIVTYTQGDQLVVEVTDDGGGVNAARLRRKAVESGILSLEDVLELSDAETMNLAFATGLSTATAVNEVSGRGLGLAVVKDTVDRLGGHKAVESTSGVGTMFRLVLPMRGGPKNVVRVLEAITPTGIYAIPASTVTRVLRLAQGRFEWNGRQRVLVLDGDRIPVLHLDYALGGRWVDTDPESHCSVLVMQSAGRRVAWIVERIGGMPEVTVRSLDGVTSFLGAVPGVAGVVLSGDDTMLVLDVAHLIGLTTELSMIDEAAYVYLESKAS